jgi:hypothetical protein
VTENGYKTVLYRWTEPRARAAILVADDELSDHAIAREVGVTRNTLAVWKRDPSFVERVNAHVAEKVAAMKRLAIAKVHKRVAVLDQLHTKTLAVIEHRAERYRAQAGDDAEAAATQAAKRVFGSDTPFEATTGLLVEKETITNAGHRTVEWSVDVGLMKEIRALHQQAAEELGQKVERSEMAVSGSVERVYVIVPPSDEPPPPLPPEVGT